jgi:hypothetical protein
MNDIFSDSSPSLILNTTKYSISHHSSVIFVFNASLTILLNAFLTFVFNVCVEDKYEIAVLTVMLRLYSI